MDQASKLKLTKFGFHLNLLGASSFLSVLGIVVSIIGILVIIFLHVYAIHLNPVPGCGGWEDNLASFSLGAFILMIPYLTMWILLKIKTRKQDIHGIEKIGKVYSYIAMIMYCSWAVNKQRSYSSSNLYYRPSPVTSTGC